MKKLLDRELKRIYRHRRIRKTMSGSSDRPRLFIHRSLKNLSAQIVNDTERKVLFGMSTLNKTVKGKIKNGGNVDAAAVLGESVAEEAKKKGITKVCFDRGGYKYHGRVKAFADAARKAGLEF